MTSAAAGQPAAAIVLGVGRDVVPASAEAAEPVQRPVTLPRDVVRFGALLLGQFAVDGAEGGEVTTERARQQALLVAAHRRRTDELVERLPLRRQLDVAIGLEDG